jgi:hypothetical protein
VHSPTLRFLHNELSRTEQDMQWLDLWNDPTLLGEYQRRCTIIQELIPLAVTPEAALAAVEQRLIDADMLLTELADAGDVETAEMLLIDAEYLTGLLERMTHYIQGATVVYALDGLDI